MTLPKIQVYQVSGLGLATFAPAVVIWLPDSYGSLHLATTPPLRMANQSRGFKALLKFCVRLSEDYITVAIRSK